MIELPIIPFEVYYEDYDKTVYVVASCNQDTWQSETYVLNSKEKLTITFITEVLNKAFDTPGVTRIQICRKDA